MKIKEKKKCSLKKEKKFMDMKEIKKYSLKKEGRHKMLFIFDKI